MAGNGPAITSQGFRYQPQAAGASVPTAVLSATIKAASLLAAGKAADVSTLRDRVTRLAREFPLYDGLEDWSLV